MNTLQNHQPDWSHYQPVSHGMFWPDHQIFPCFSTPAQTLDSFCLSCLSDDMRITLTVLQGLVNREKPRIYLDGIFSSALGEGADTWPDRLHLQRKEWTDLFAFLRTYQQCADGLVLYDGFHPHMRNLASTAANVRHLLPVDAAALPALRAHGITLPVKIDMTGLKFDSPAALYRYLHETYWPECTRRLLFSMTPTVQSAYIRDLAAAVGGAVVSLDARIPEEQACLELFFKDMPAGNSAAVGWWPEERSGVGTGSKYGISTVPSDFYENATVHAGLPHIMHIPAVPKKPELENKIYLAVFMSDGDNIQYCQHHLPKLWADPKRGTVPLNWTASPSLVDIGPGIINYFYDTATEQDCICSGPSGLGYALIYDDENKTMWMDDAKKVDAYTKFSNPYLLKNSMRALTVWDRLREDQAACYEKNCRALYGVTVQHPEDDKLVIANRRMPFIRNFPAYTRTLDQMYQAMGETVRTYDFKKPLFLAAQGVTWSMGAANMKTMLDTFNQMNPGAVEILRGDHFFALLNEANGCPFNLALSGRVRVSVNDSRDASVILSGSPYGENLWEASCPGSREFLLDLDQPYLLSRYVLRNAGVNDENTDRNNRAFTLSVSETGEEWILLDARSQNSCDMIDADFSPCKARYVKLTVTEGGLDGIVRIGDLELYGARI